MPSEHPILFSGPMVRAIGEGRKTQTRRVIANLLGLGRVSELGVSETVGYGWTCRDSKMRWHDLRDDGLLARCPYGVPGDRLWVRETWGAWPHMNGGVQRDSLRFRADGEYQNEHGAWRWRPSIHMPRWASRYTLEVTDVRVERVQGISVEDAIAELGGRAAGIVNEQGHFHELWDNINAKRGHPWAANDWVWAITFKPVEAKP